MENKPKIDFIGIGSAKSATTWIAQCLSEHPEICMSNPKEPAFFTEANYQKGFGWYARNFSHCAGEKVRGEFSCAYLRKARCAQRIKEAYPNAKLIVCLRNPIERLRSAYHYHHSKSYSEQLDVQQALWPNNQEIEHELRKGLYYKLLSPYLEHFSRDQILILIYKDIAKDPLVFMQKVYKFLGVDHTFRPESLHTTSNITASNRVRVRAIHRIYYALFNTIHRMPFGEQFLNVTRWLGLHALIRIILRWNRRPEVMQKPMEKQELTEEQERALYKYYKEDIAQIERLTDRRLDSWHVA